MVKIEPFGTYQKKAVQLITLKNKQGMIVKCATLGCTITEIVVKDRYGNFENVVCGFSNVRQYMLYPQFFGAAIGPFAGRLENAVVEIDDQSYQTIPNEGRHLLHGGTDGFHAQIWSYEVGETDSSQFVRFIFTRKYVNFPGNITMKIMYTLTDANELVIDYEGFSDKKTLLNVTNHSYFNLSGNLKHTILDHELMIAAEGVLYIDEEGVPIPKWIAMNQTPFKFYQPLRQIIEKRHEQIVRASGGIDHPFLLAKQEITLKDKSSGRMLTISTDQPCAVIYTGQKIGAGFDFHANAAKNFSGICIEVQNVPNSVLHKNLPSSIITPDEKYKQTTRYHFTTIES